jgi:hypothetical protein
MERLVLRGATILDGVSAAPLRGHAVVVEAAASPR